MSTVITTSVLPDSTANDTLTIGATGDSVAISGDSLNMNTLQDAGGNTTFVSDGSGTLSTINSGFGDALVLLSTQTASSSASISFTTGFDSTYDVYCFKFITIHASGDGAHLQFQTSTDGGSSYGVSLKSAFWIAKYAVAGGSTQALEYDTGWDTTNSTDYQHILIKLGTDNTQAGSGELWFFGPSGTTFEKHYYSRGQTDSSVDYTYDAFGAGYFNTASAINAIQFKNSTGNIDAGTFKLYGLSKS